MRSNQRFMSSQPPWGMGIVALELISPASVTRTTFAGELHRSDSTQQKPAPAPYCWGLSNKPANNGKLGSPQRLLRHIVSNRSKNSQESENSRRSSNKRYSSNSTTLRVSIASGELVRSTLYRQLVSKSNLL